MLDKEMADKLLDIASRARENATPKRTGIRVGAALLAENGDIITGSNMELASMMSGICAERCAIAKALSEGYRKFTAIAVVADAKKVNAPCSFCRQFLIDLGLDLEVIMANGDLSEAVNMTVGELVPMPFLGMINQEQGDTE